MLYYIGRTFFALLYKFFGRYRVIGRQHVPRTGGVMLAANHTSYADPPLVGIAASCRRVYFMGKQELFAHPLANRILRAVGAFPVKRGSADREALRTATTLLKHGEALMILPEGATSPDGTLQAPELGAAMIALRANVPIVPMAIINTDKMQPRHGKGMHFTHVQVIIGEPITFPHLEGKASDRAALKEVSDTVMRRIADLMRAHGAEERVPAGYLGEEAETEDAQE